MLALAFWNLDGITIVVMVLLYREIVDCLAVRLRHGGR
jgi:hypothetical protein